AAVSTLVLVCSSAEAQTYSGTFPIDATQVVPPNASPATGTGMVTLDTGTNMLTWNITSAGLLAPETVAHFHGPAAVGANAGVQLPIAVGSPSAGSATVSASQAADILAGLWYVVIHSSMFPGGEIRGQVQVSAVVPAVPAMSEWGAAALVLLLLLSASWVMRQRGV
ncbi:MAG: CHRD domain-containing protein, partial [Planctomycetes bacterium]|nr:CHRD domain-containing protein [Planctomycetota bacterium]